MMRNNLISFSYIIKIKTNPVKLSTVFMLFIWFGYLLHNNWNAEWVRVNRSIQLSNN